MGYVTSNPSGRESRYELAEPLMRLSMQVKDTRDHQPLELIVDFLRVWYDREDLEQRLARIAPAAPDREYPTAALAKLQSGEPASAANSCQSLTRPGGLCCGAGLRTASLAGRLSTAPGAATRHHGDRRASPRSRPSSTFRTARFPKRGGPKVKGPPIFMGHALSRLSPFEGRSRFSAASTIGRRWLGPRRRRPCTRQRHLPDGCAVEEERDRHPGGSVDRPGHRAAIGQLTRFPSLEACDRRIHKSGACDSGYACRINTTCPGARRQLP